MIYLVPLGIVLLGFGNVTGDKGGSSGGGGSSSSGSGSSGSGSSGSGSSGSGSSGSGSSGSGSGSKLSVDIYYEGLCPDCWDFIIDQLYPVYTTKCKKMSLQMVPFGHTDFAITEGKYCFTCKHGPVGCYANKVHACGLKHLTTGRMKFIKCLVECSRKNSPTKESDFPLKACVSGSDFDEIEACATGQEGDRLLAEMGVKTSSLNATKFEIPYISFNHKADDRVSEKARKNFATVFNFYSDD